MALAAVGFAKARRRRQIMVATSSIGPGAMNMVTAAGTAHANRLPILMLAGDVFANRMPDPVLQQVEHFGDPTMTVNDAFKAVSRYWNRITLPEQIIASLPQAVATMLDPGDCGPAFLALCQDTQEIAYDYPEAFFEPTLWTIPRPRPDRRRVTAAAELLRTAKAPVLIAGGGVRYAGAEEAVAAFARRYRMNANLLFKWLRDPRFAPIETPAPLLPVNVIASAPEEAQDPAPASAAVARIEIELPSGAPGA